MATENEFEEAWIDALRKINDLKSEVKKLSTRSNLGAKVDTGTAECAVDF